MSVDGQQYFSFAKEPGGDSVWPFDKPQYLILNLAIGGDWGGPPDATTQFPATMLVDYVRVWQAGGAAAFDP